MAAGTSADEIDVSHEGLLAAQMDPYVRLDAVRDETGSIIDFVFIDANEAACEHTGIGREDLVGAHLLTLPPGHVGSGLFVQYCRVVDTGESMVLDDFTYDQELLRQERVYDLRAVKVADGLSCSWRDVSDRHQAAKQLADSEARFSLIADNTSDVLLLGDPQMNIHWVSNSITSAFGWAPGDTVGHAAADFIHPDDLPGVAAAVASASSAGPLRQRYRWRCADDSYRWVEAVGREIVMPAGERRLVVSLRDIDDRIRVEQRYRMIAENSSDVVFQSDLAGVIQWISPSVQDLLGRAPEAVVGTDALAMVDEADQPVVRSLRPGVYGGMPTSGAELRVVAADGTRLYVSAIAKPLRDASGSVIGAVVGWRNIDEQVRARREAEDMAKMYRLMVENTMDLVISLDTKAVIQWVSPSATRLLGYEPSELVGQFGGILINPEDLSTLLEAAAEAREGRPTVCRIRMRTVSGADTWVDADPRGNYDDAGNLVGGVIGVRDVNDEVHAQQALQLEVEFDALTGLAKRPLALALIQEMLEGPPAEEWALLCVGVNGLTAVNQAYTYAAGDEILRAVAQRLLAATGTSDSVARIAGDEFAVLIRDIASLTDAASEAERLLTAVRGPVTVDQDSINVTACAGIARATDQDAEGLLRDAAAAIRQAAANGPDRWGVLGGDVANKTRQDLKTQAMLRRAIEKDEIRAWFMPVIDLLDDQTRGYEALIRWVKEDGSVVGPVEFLEVAERSDLIIDIDRAALGQGLESLDTLPPAVWVAVNVSAASLSRGDLFEYLGGELARTGADPTRLHLEVTETALFHVTEAVQAMMQRVADLGVSWWVDDFGTGYSSISHLRDPSQDSSSTCRSPSRSPAKPATGPRCSPVVLPASPTDWVWPPSRRALRHGGRPTSSLHKAGRWDRGGSMERPRRWDPRAHSRILRRAQNQEPDRSRPGTAGTSATATSTADGSGCQPGEPKACCQRARHVWACHTSEAIAANSPHATFTGL